MFLGKGVLKKSSNTVEHTIRNMSSINLLCNVFNSIKEINMLRKELNRLLSKGMSNIYLKVTIETFSKLRFSGLTGCGFSIILILIGIIAF